MNEVVTALVVYSISMLLLWASSYNDEKVKENWKRPFGIFIRMCAFHLILHLFLFTLPIETWKSYLFIAIMVGLSFVTWSSLIGAAFIGIAWAIYQWAFWFPVKDEVVLKNEIKEPKKKEEFPLGHGVASTDLKPIGKAIFEGKEYTAISSLGFIPSGERILIESKNGTELKVRKETMC